MKRCHFIGTPTHTQAQRNARMPLATLAVFVCKHFAHMCVCVCRCLCVWYWKLSGAAVAESNGWPFTGERVARAVSVLLVKTPQKCCMYGERLPIYKRFLSPLCFVKFGPNALCSDLKWSEIWGTFILFDTYAPHIYNEGICIIK